jgi:hypothetical protein
MSPAKNDPSPSNPTSALSVTISTKFKLIVSSSPLFS